MAIDSKLLPQRDPKDDATGASVQTLFGTEIHASGELARQAQQKYQYTTLQYPLDLGEGTRHPYYVTFYVNIQDLSKWARPGAIDDLVARDPNTGLTIPSTVAINQRELGGSIAQNVRGTNIGFGRKTSRTKLAIRLYLPDTLAWNSRNSFNTPSLSGLPGTKATQAISGAASAGAAAADAWKNGSGISGVLASLGAKGRGAIGPFVESTIGGAIGDEALALSAFGLAVNPQIDVIYNSPELRTFNFEFMFAPRSASESREIRSIINQFRFHAAPEVYAEKGEIYGRYFVPPSEFDIEFSVRSLGQISTCVLEDIAVDYGPVGASFYSDDSPSHIRLTLSFRELEFVTKEFVQREIKGTEEVR